MERGSASDRAASSSRGSRGSGDSADRADIAENTKEAKLTGKRGFNAEALSGDGWQWPLCGVIMRQNVQRGLGLVKRICGGAGEKFLQRNKNCFYPARGK